MGAMTSGVRTLARSTAGNKHQHSVWEHVLHIIRSIRMDILWAGFGSYHVNECICKGFSRLDVVQEFECCLWCFSLFIDWRLFLCCGVPHPLSPTSVSQISLRETIKVRTELKLNCRTHYTLSRLLKEPRCFNNPNWRMTFDSQMLLKSSLISPCSHFVTLRTKLPYLSKNMSQTVWLINRRGLKIWNIKIPKFSGGFKPLTHFRIQS